MPLPEAQAAEVSTEVTDVLTRFRSFAITGAEEQQPNQAQQSLTTTARKKTPKKPQRVPRPGLQLVSLHFYESGKDIPPAGEYQYGTHFSQRTARYIAADLVLRNRLYKKRRQTFHLAVHYYNPDGALEGKIEDDNSLTSSWTGWSCSLRWGFDEPGTWELGTYRVAILIDGVEIGEGSFTIADAEAFPPPSEDSAEGQARSLSSVSEGTAMQKIHYPLSMELITRVLDGLEVQYSRDPEGDIVIPASSEQFGNKEVFVWISISGENRDRLLIRGGVNVQLLESEFVQALATCNEFNKMTFYGRAMLHIDDDDDTVGRVYFDSRILLTDGVAEDFLRSFIEQSLYCSGYFFSMAHDEGLF
jgi:Putative bacterial sensory transduction regulator